MGLVDPMRCQNPSSANASSNVSMTGSAGRRSRLSIVLFGASIAACGGGSDSPPPPAPPPPAVFLPQPPPPAVVLPPLITDTPVRISADTPFAANCTGGALGGTEFRNSEVEPYAAVNPTSVANIVAVWQQDRWSSGLANGLVTATTLDGGATWTRTGRSVYALRRRHCGQWR